MNYDCLKICMKKNNEYLLVPIDYIIIKLNMIAAVASVGIVGL